MADDGASITTQPGDVWEADVDLAFWEEFDSDDDIASRFTAAGFADVTCTGSGGVRHVQGTWPGPTKTIPLSSMDPHLANFRKLSGP